MPQVDKRRLREIPVEFNAVENLNGLPYYNRLTLVLITDGKAVVSIHGEAKTFIAPCILCLSEQDKIEIIENRRLYAQSFSFNPSYLLKNRMTYKQIKNSETDVLHLFYHRNDYYNGVLDLPQDFYIKILEWMSVIGIEITAQSDSRWTCRVRAYFLRVLNMLDEIYSSKDIKINKQTSNVDEILEYLHTHYMEDISLEMLCRQTHTNRTTLNKNFKERTGQTVIAYLLDYRLRIARELLAHTGLTIDEIARAAGFIYDTYLIRQFAAKSGQTPTEYRQEARRKYGITVYKN